MLSRDENYNQDRLLVCQDVEGINKYDIDYRRRYRLSVVYNLALEINFSI